MGGFCQRHALTSVQATAQTNNSHASAAATLSALLCAPFEHATLLHGLVHDRSAGKRNRNAHPIFCYMCHTHLTAVRTHAPRGACPIFPQLSHVYCRLRVYEVMLLPGRSLRATRA